ncbi:hypothetical protein SDC9_39914 [bioreactor metagenome]|uniref:Uncharacterized protein n=1 Tax=bioreactor metagenome TaxID=1076179 RepID=A0A644VR73_9ZZZZ
MVTLDDKYLGCGLATKSTTLAEADWSIGPVSAEQGFALRSSFRRKLASAGCPEGAASAEQTEGLRARLCLATKFLICDSRRFKRAKRVGEQTEILRLRIGREAADLSRARLCLATAVGFFHAPTIILYTNSKYIS